MDYLKTPSHHLCHKILSLQAKPIKYYVINLWDKILELLRIRKVLRIQDSIALEFESALSIETLICLLKGIKPNWQLHIHYPHYGLGYRMEYFTT